MLWQPTEKNKFTKAVESVTAVLVMLTAYEQLKMMRKMNQETVPAEAKLWYDLTRLLNKVAYLVGRAAIWTENKYRSYAP